MPHDLEQGNSAKGLSSGVGSGTGDWRLKFVPDEGLIITPLAYVRTTDGFVTSMHDLAPYLSENNLDYVPIFNPGSNHRQESLLRVTNLADDSNRVVVSGVDDAGNAAREAPAFLLPAGGSRTLSAKALEEGTSGLEANLGDGAGKWSLFIQGESRVQVMSLLQSPTGNLTNLSATPFSFALHTTRAPVAHDISLSAGAASPYLEAQLMATDPEGDPIAFYLDGESQGQGYEEAYIDPEQGRLYATLRPEGRSTIRIPFRASDGYEFSDRAYVVVTVEEPEEQGLGANDVPYAEYAELSEAFFDPAIRSDFEDGTLSLPSAIDLAGNFPAVGSQGQQSSCVGWAAAWLKSYHERIEEGWDFRQATTFSPAWIYNQINRGRDEGSNPVHALRLIVSSGAATLATMPYDPSDHLAQPSNRAIAEASQFLALEAYTLRSVEGWKAALTHRVPFVIGIPIYPSFHRLSGTGSAYNNLSGESQGGHAVVVVGYDDDRFGGSFKVLNSWGQGWGDRGFFYLPYNVLRDAKMRNVQAFMLQDGPNRIDDHPRPQPRRSCDQPTNTQPNLVIDRWQARYDPEQGGHGTWEWSVVNRGNGTASAGVDMNLLLSSDRTIDSSDHWVIYEEIPFAMEPGGGAYRDGDNARNFTFPQTIPPRAVLHGSLGGRRQ